MQIMHPLKKSVLTLLAPKKRYADIADTLKKSIETFETWHVRTTLYAHKPLKRVLRHLRHLKKGMGRLGRP